MSTETDGQKLHRIWAESCPWSSVGFEHDWQAMHPHTQAKWEALADELKKRATAVTSPSASQSAP